MLSEDYVREAEMRARRFSGAYTGTSGTLAADVLRLIQERAALLEVIRSSEAGRTASGLGQSIADQGTSGL